MENYLKMDKIKVYNQWQEVKNRRQYNWITLDLIGFQLDFDRYTGECIIAITLLGLCIDINFVYNQKVWEKFKKTIKKRLKNKKGG